MLSARSRALHAAQHMQRPGARPAGKQRGRATKGPSLSAAAARRPPRCASRGRPRVVRLERSVTNTPMGTASSKAQRQKSLRQQQAIAVAAAQRRLDAGGEVRERGTPRQPRLAPGTLTRLKPRKRRPMRKRVGCCSCGRGHGKRGATAVVQRHNAPHVPIKVVVGGKTLTQAIACARGGTATEQRGSVQQLHQIDPATTAIWKNEPAENGGNILATSNKVLHTKILKLLKPFTKKS